MANKKLGTAATELRLPTKKVKGEKKPKWQAKTGGTKAKGQGSEAQETVAQDELTTPPEPSEIPVVATTPEHASVEPTTTTPVTASLIASAARQPQQHRPPPHPRLRLQICRQHLNPDVRPAPRTVALC